MTLVYPTFAWHAKPEDLPSSIGAREVTLLTLSGSWDVSIPCLETMTDLTDKKLPMRGRECWPLLPETHETHTSASYQGVISGT